jgi:hypothetical protein
MIKYREKNLNSKGIVTGDCVTRAIAGVLNITWEEALGLQFLSALELNCDPESSEVIEKIMTKKGYKKSMTPRKESGEKYCLNEADEFLKEEELKNGILVLLPQIDHCTCITNGYVQDTSDWREHAIGTYYAKIARKRKKK